MACYKRFIFVFLILILFLSYSKCFAVEDIPYGYNLINQNLLFSSTQITTSGDISYSQYSNVYYIDISNFDSVLYFNTKGLRYVLTDTIDFVSGDNVNAQVNSVTSNTTGIYLDTSTISENYILLSYTIDSVVTVYGKDYSEFNNSVSSLVENVGPDALWGVFGSGIDFVLVVVLVAFGIFIIVKVIRGISKGKSKI